MNVKQIFGKRGTLAALAVFALINMAAASFFSHARLDLTQNKLNTLTEGTRNILAALEEPVGVRLYLSRGAMEDLPGLKAYAGQIEALLEEYRLRSDGKLTVETIDPLPFSEAEDEAVSAGLQGVPVAGGDTLYFGLVAQSAAQRQTIPFFQPERETFLEYDLSQLIYRLTHPQRKVVGVLSAVDLQGGFLRGQGMGEPVMMIEQLRAQFTVRHLPQDEAAIAEDIDLLLLVHPHGLGDTALYAADQFVLGGGAAVVLADPHSEARPPGMMAPAESNPTADRLLAAWGVRLLQDKLVGDPNLAQQVTYRDRFGRGQAMRYLPWLSLGPQQYNRDEMLVNQLDRVNLASAGALEEVAGKANGFTPLITSTAQAGLIDKFAVAFGADPAALLAGFKPEGRDYVLAARISGAFATAFPDGPPAQETREEKPGEEGAAEEARPEQIKVGEKPANLIVIADSDLIQDRFWVQINNFFGQRLAVPTAANLDLMTNALEILGGSPDLISVRSRGTYQRPFELVAEIQQQAEGQYRAREQELVRKLEETEAKLSELQRQRDDAGSAQLTPEQQQEVDQFVQEKVKTRKKLREVQYQLRADIEDLEQMLKMFNIAFVPALLGFAAFVAWVIRRGRGRTY